MDKYTFGEKEEEYINGKMLPVKWITPKYKEAKKKVIELLESKEYKNVLEESDFWILVNTYDNKTKAMYSGLIISHNGCLKINDTLDEKMKFKPNCVIREIEPYKKELLYTYINDEQGIYEVGEVSPSNCKNDYPHAMAYKRLFDRVVLKNSKLAYSGVYSDSEADEFKERPGIQEDKKITPYDFVSDEEKLKAEPINEGQKQMVISNLSKEEIKNELINFKKSKLSELSWGEAQEILEKKDKELDKKFKEEKEIF